tara:strand:- start:46 stop:333 length:288 start_codon:yes stop_codon:yes gene_type:complete
MLIVWATKDVMPLLPIAAMAGVDISATIPTITESRGSLKKPLMTNTENSANGGPSRATDMSARVTEIASKKQLIATPNAHPLIDSANNAATVATD